MGDGLRRRRIANALLAAALLLCAALLLDPPAQSSLYPACPIREYLGIQCPGCGATRALAAMLRGRIRQAVHLNALFVLLLPGLLAWAIETYRRAVRPGDFRWPNPPAPVVCATLAATALFTLVRNLVH